MKIKDLFGGRKSEQTVGKTEKPADAANTEAQQQAVNEVLHELISLEKEGKLTHPLQEYFDDEKFIKLLTEHAPHSAVVIYDLMTRLKDAEQNARKTAQDEMQRMRMMPRSIRGGSPVEQETDFSKLSTEEFEKLKKRIASGR